MRVISGTARGHKLFAPTGLSTRPTADRIKETMFNIIANDLPGCVFLDLFSGTGAIGIEALSRGAKKAFFVDNSNESIKCIELNLSKTKLRERAEILNNDATEAVRILGERRNIFDIIFLDPPYLKADFNIDLITEAGILSKGGYVIAERGDADIKTKRFKIIRTKEFKSAKLIFFSVME